jgi:hypothetical protein
MNQLNINKRSVLLVPLLLFLAAIVWPLASANASVYSWDTNNPNTALNPNTGEIITLQGACVFDTGAKTVAGQGSFRITAPNGTVVSRGQWSATSFVSYVSDGGFSNGLQAGTLKIYITLYPTSGTPLANQLMTTICPIENGVFDEGDDGTTVGGFNTITGGITIFHLLRP